jgi:alkaline phosphatase D
LLSFGVLNAQEKFSFITGSCAFLDREKEDYNGVMYDGDTSIFYSMSRSKANFMLWLGDNWYLNKDETKTVGGLWKKAVAQRSSPLLQRISQNMTEYAIWDDHDYGDNNSYKKFPLKTMSRNIFINMWKFNPSYGLYNDGIYTSFHYKNVLFVLLDDRWWRDRDKKKSYLGRFMPFVKGKPNPNKKMFGEQQMDWLKKTLVADTSDFKIIVNGSQMLNPISKRDCFAHFPIEYNDLMSFLEKQKIKGVLFLSGDRHFSEIIKIKRKNSYPLYDVTVSSLTAQSDYPRGIEANNPYRLLGSLKIAHNYATFSFDNSDVNKKLTVTFHNNKGWVLYHWSILANELR